MNDSGSLARGQPLIGLLVFDKSPRLHLPPLRLRALAAEALMQGARLALFAADDCDPDTGRLAAEHWSGGEWVRQPTRWPDVVIVATNARGDRKAQVDEWVQARGPHIRDTGPDKLALPALVAATPLRRHLIPQQRIDPAAPAAQIAAWLAARGDAVVKPVSGKRGSGIIRLHAEDCGGFRLWRDGEVRPFATAADAAAEAARLIAGRLRYRDYLLQRYVETVAADGRAADIRVHLQRDGAGAWQVTRGYVRLAEAGAATSNVSRGGYQAELDRFLPTRRVRAPAVLLPEIEQLALGVARLIERDRGRDLSELGVDLAIDPADRLWLIEANARPQTSLHEQLRAIRTIGYALFLARGG